MKEKLTCSYCGAELTEETAQHFDGVTMCEECLDAKTVTCDNCGERTWKNDSIRTNYVTLCVGCYENHYTSCDECGCLLHNDDALYDEDNDRYYCQSCYNSHRNRAIKSYYYKPDPIFYGSGSLYMGVELEIDKGGEDNANAEKLLDIANRVEEKIYCKHDGSLHDGFEILSHPMTLEYHETMNWKELFDKAIEMDYRSHNTSTCGLHIHVNRSAFGDSFYEQEEKIARVVHFVELHWNELLKFSRRTEDSINHWASRYGIMTTAKETYDNAKKKHTGRYVAVNLENVNTIEFRLFRGSLRYETFISVLQLVYEICRFAIMLSDKELENMSWSEFVLKIDKDTSKPTENTYIQDLKIFAKYNGYDDSDVDALLAEGFSPEEIEEMVYCGYEY